MKVVPQEVYLQRFKEILDEMYKTTERKNTDYAGTKDAFKNFKLCEDLNLTTVEKGILVRMSDKFQRIANLVETSPKVTSEAISDTLLDLAVYSIILRIWLDDQDLVVEK